MELSIRSDSAIPPDVGLTAAYSPAIMATTGGAMKAKTSH